MPPHRPLRRTNPISWVLAALLLTGFFLFFFSSDAPNDLEASKEKKSSNDPASNVLSPPSLPFRKPKKKSKVHVTPPVVHYHLNNITTSSQPIQNRETVLILTPLTKFYQGYWDNLINLTYPHELISLGFIIPKDAAGHAATRELQKYVAQTQSGEQSRRFASITILRQDFENPLTSQLEQDRHKLEKQKIRRAAMARARNSLLFTTLGPTTSWVLWLDGDIVETPPTLIQDLALHDKPIIVPNCFQRFYNATKEAMDVRPYDFNSWVDSDQAKDLAKKMGKDDILLEGYPQMATYRSLMAYIPKEISGQLHTELLLDGVGGTALLVKADVHRDGAMFPPFAFYHLIETEGFAKMASRLGWQAYGLPFYYIYHYNE